MIKGYRLPTLGPRGREVMETINEIAAEWEDSHGNPFYGVPASHAAMDTSAAVTFTTDTSFDLESYLSEGTDEDERVCTLHQAVACVLLKRLNRGG